MILNTHLSGGVNTKDATATASDILSGKTAYVGKEKVTGEMQNNGTVSKTLTLQGETFAIPEGYHDGNGEVAVQISGLSADVIKKDAVVGGVTGEFAGGIPFENVPKVYNVVNSNGFTGYDGSATSINVGTNKIKMIELSAVHSSAYHGTKIIFGDSFND